MKMKKFSLAIFSLLTTLSFLPVLADEYIGEEPPSFYTEQLLPTWLNVTIIVIASLVAIGIVIGIVKNVKKKNAKKAK